MIVLAIYVDDGMIVAKDSESIDYDVVSYFQQQFEIKVGDGCFLGIGI